jgi:DNA-binding NtrC family response regulator
MGEFRQDLFYRLNVVAIQLPPLRQRREDIPLLAQHFLKHYSEEDGKMIATISDKAMDLLCSYSWPGNIRELENAIEQAVALSYQPVLTPEDLPRDVREQSTLPQRSEASPKQNILADTPSMEEVKKRYVLHVLEQTQGNVSATARILNVDRRSLYRMLARYKIEPFVKED